MPKPEPRSRPGPKDLPAGIEVLGPMKAGYDRVLTPESLSFFADLQRRFDPVRRDLLASRGLVQRKLDGGWKPTFLSATSEVRESEWRVAPLPRDLLDRRVEITGPVERKMIINALNSGANVFMADFEDSNTPTFANVIEGQINLQDAVRRTITFQQPGTAKEYKLNDRVATLFVRPRGWHLPERHVLVDGEPASGALFDFAMFFFHNAVELLKRGTGPYFYIAKLESHLEARLWRDVFCAAEDALALRRGTIKATVLIETILAAFEMDEILHELREHSAGLNCGRWDYIFSFIKKFREDPACVLPDRGLVTMDKAFLRAYSLRLIQTCHRRGVHAMGGMAPQIPIKDDPARNAAALEKVRADKRREATDGHDGTWVAHPALVGIAKEEFDRVLEDRPNQIERLREDVVVREPDLLRVHDGPITEAGLRLNLNVGLLYLESWLGGVGCVPIHNLMEDAATAEISRTQVWQWLKHSAHLADGRKIEPTLVRRILSEEIHLIRAAWSEDRNQRGHLNLAGSIFEQLIISHQLEDFLTLPAYERILTLSHTGAD